MRSTVPRGGRAPARSPAPPPAWRWPLLLALGGLGGGCERVEPPGARPERPAAGPERRGAARAEASAGGAPRGRKPARPPRPPENPAVRPPGPLLPAAAPAPPDPGVVASAAPMAALAPELPVSRSAPAPREPAPGAADEAAPCPAPSALDELGRRAQRLIEAGLAEDARLADPLFFPAAPFVALKDARDPEGYHAILLARFRAELTPWLRRQTGWSAARVVRVEAGRPRRIAAGERANKLAYCELTGAALLLDLMGERVELPIHTLASAGGRWYVTHLRAP